MSTLQMSFDDYGYPLPDTRQQHSYLSDDLMQHNPIYSQEHLDVTRSHSHYPYAPQSTMGSCDPQDAYHHSYSIPHDFHAREREDYATEYPPPPPIALPDPSHVENLAAFDPNRTLAVLQNLQSVIDSTHTTRTQYAQAQSEADGPLTGALDPRTGDFQPTVESHRQRTQHACEPCRERKVKCSGDMPCQYCSKMGKECVYGERKMRGPNKKKREEGEVTEDLELTLEFDSVPGSSRGNSVDQAELRPDGHYRNISVYSISSESADGSSSSGQASTSQFSLGSPLLRPATANLSGPSSLQNSPTLSARALPGRRPRALTISNGHIAAGRLPTSCTRTARSRRSRPPPLNLFPKRDGIPQVPGVEYASSADLRLVPAEYTEAASTRSIRARPTSLPAHLIDQYSRAVRDGIAYQGVPASSQNAFYPGHTEYAYIAPRQLDAASAHTHSDSSTPASFSPAPYSRELEHPHPISAPPGDHLSFDYLLGALDLPVSAPADVSFGATPDIHMLDAALNYRYSADTHMEYDYATYESYAASEAGAGMDVDAYAPSPLGKAQSSGSMSDMDHGGASEHPTWNVAPWDDNTPQAEITQRVSELFLHSS